MPKNQSNSKAKNQKTTQKQASKSSKPNRTEPYTEANTEPEQKLWGGRFSRELNNQTWEQMWNYSKSIGIDYKLADYDICGSIAHVKMLAHCGHLSQTESKKIQKALLEIYQESKAPLFIWNQNSEDIHSNVEQMLYTKIGALAGKMHMGRSRNDQVALDFHMYLRDNIVQVQEELHKLIEVCIYQAEQHIDTIIPGYTHMQRAEPIRFAQHIMAYASMFLRDTERLQDIWKRANVSPLGAGAFSGSPLKIDSSISASLLCFDAVYENSMDAVSDRDFAVELLAGLSLVHMHISKLSEELVLWSSQEFSFVELADEFCTGSSMMPQKRNPDLAELARGKTGTIYGSLMSLLTTLKGLPLSYNRDLQEDKKPVFEAVETVRETISLFSRMIYSMKVNTTHTEQEANKDFSNATEIANYLSQKNIPFREAHVISGMLVMYCIDKGVLLKDLSIEEYRQFSKDIDEDIYKAIEPLQVIEKHSVRGGTAKKSLKSQISIQKKKLQKLQIWINAQREKSSITHIIKRIATK